MELQISLTPFNLPTNPNGPDPLTSSTTGECLLNQSTTVTSLSLLTSTPTNLSPSKSHDLFLDGEICDNVLMPRTFLYSGQPLGTTAAERLAWSIGLHHMGGMEGLKGVDNFHVEYWFQIRPTSSLSSKARSAVASTSVSSDEGGSLGRNGIVFHYDKDEDLHLKTGLHVHPHLSTVTYITPSGGPTVVVDRILEGPGGTGGEGGGNVEGATVVFPGRGKHMKFDGRKLHGGDPKLLPKGAEWPPCDEEIARGYGLRGSEGWDEWSLGNVRVTFLVNLWCWWKPMGVERMGEGWRRKMSGFKEEENAGAGGGGEEGREEKKEEDIKNVLVRRGEGEVYKYELSVAESGTEETLEVRVDKDIVNGEDCRLTWEEGGDARVVVGERGGKKRREGEEGEGGGKRAKTCGGGEGN
ncbi:hypothetical protein TrCOL_g1774 [Triparma columacea]|uniref:Uncharacterized protein n=1 Tax=Triparma columacea TaxID=722753 RepID=A0A9W7GAW1_9STRA|nr:hypothetical protein TrCOL_g1774 [Triparma columacea]